MYRALRPITLVAMILVAGCGQQGPAKEGRSIKGAWFAVDPFAQDLVGIEFTEEGQAIITERKGTHELESFTLAYSVLDGNRINLVLPGFGISEMATFDRKRDHLTLKSSGGDLRPEGEFRAAGARTPRNLYNEAYTERIVAQWKVLDEFLGLSKGQFMVLLPEGSRPTDAREPDSGPISLTFNLGDRTTDDANDAVVVASLMDSGLSSGAREYMGTARVDPWHIDIDLGEGREALTFGLVHGHLVGRGTLLGLGKVPQAGSFAGWEEWFRGINEFERSMGSSRSQRDRSRVNLVLEPDVEAQATVERVRKERAERAAAEAERKEQTALAERQAIESILECGPWFEGWWSQRGSTDRHRMISLLRFDQESGEITGQAILSDTALVMLQGSIEIMDTPLQIESGQFMGSVELKIEQPQVLWSMQQNHPTVAYRLVRDKEVSGESWAPGMGYGLMGIYQGSRTSGEISLDPISDERLAAERQATLRYLEGNGYQFKGIRKSVSRNWPGTSTTEEQFKVSIRKVDAKTVEGHIQNNHVGSLAFFTGTLDDISGRYELSLSETELLRQPGSAQWKPATYRVMMDTGRDEYKFAGWWSRGNTTGSVMLSPVAPLDTPLLRPTAYREQLRESIRQDRKAIEQFVQAGVWLEGWYTERDAERRRGEAQLPVRAFLRGIDNSERIVGHVEFPDIAGYELEASIEEVDHQAVIVLRSTKSIWVRRFFSGAVSWKLGLVQAEGQPVLAGTWGNHTPDKQIQLKALSSAQLSMEQQRVRHLLQDNGYRFEGVMFEGTVAYDGVVLDLQALPKSGEVVGVIGHRALGGLYWKFRVTGNLGETGGKCELVLRETEVIEQPGPAFRTRWQPITYRLIGEEHNGAIRLAGTGTVDDRKVYLIVVPIARIEAPPR